MPCYTGRSESLAFDMDARVRVSRVKVKGGGKLAAWEMGENGERRSVRLYDGNE